MAKKALKAKKRKPNKAIKGDDPLLSYLRSLSNSLGVGARSKPPAKISTAGYMLWHPRFGLSNRVFLRKGEIAPIHKGELFKIVKVRVETI